MPVSAPQVIAFVGHRCVGIGDLAFVAAQAKPALDQNQNAQLLIFDATTSEPIEVDLRGSLTDVQNRIAHPAPENAIAPTPRGPGRPKLGVVAREITLLPRHWDWLSQQPGGASVAIRKLVEDARRVNAGKDHARNMRDSLHRFMSAMAGDFPHYEDALRALYADDRIRFERSVAAWPTDVGAHVIRLAASVFEAALSPGAADR